MEREREREMTLGLLVRLAEKTRPPGEFHVSALAKEPRRESG